MVFILQCDPGRNTMSTRESRAKERERMGEKEKEREREWERKRKRERERKRKARERERERETWQQGTISSGNGNNFDHLRKALLRQNLLVQRVEKVTLMLERLACAVPHFLVHMGAL